MTHDLLLNGEAMAFKTEGGPDKLTVTYNGASHEMSLQELSAGRWLLKNSAGQRVVRVARRRDRIWVWIGGKILEFTVPSEDRAAGGAGSAPQHEVRAPMPGTLVKLLVSAGDAVEEGQMVALVEAMKMEHPLRAPRAGIVEATFGEAGKIVDADAVVISLVKEA
jgi:biotin carboxyl carrier protein